MSYPAAFTAPAGRNIGLTAHAGFNSRVDLLTVGNTYSNVQSSTFVRARNNTACNGFTFAVGHLQKTDLAVFLERDPDLRNVLAHIKREPFFENNDCIAYRIFHTIGQKRVVHGALLTDTNYQLLRRFDREDLGLQRSAKSSDVLDFALKHLAFPRPQAATAAN